MSMKKKGTRPSSKKPKRPKPSPPKKNAQGLTAKQERFVAEYLTDLNATQAAIRCGYSPKTAQVQGSRLLSFPNIYAAVTEGTKRQLERADLSASRTLEEIRRLAFFDFGTLFNTDGSLKAIKDLPVEARSALSSVEVIIKNVAAGDGMTDTIHKIKIWDKTRSLEMLAKYFKLLQDQVHVTGDWDKLAARLASARQRVSA